MMPEMSTFSHKKEKLRVAAYCRVSTKHTEQLESFEIQKSYFETVIRENPNWSLVKIYSDVGSALRTKNRPGYRQMILDGKKGLFDFLTGKQEKNDGAFSMFFVENAHKAIVDKEIFEEVQERKKAHSKNT